MAGTDGKIVLLRTGSLRNSKEKLCGKLKNSTIKTRGKPFKIEIEKRITAEISGGKFMGNNLLFGTAYILQSFCKGKLRRFGRTLNINTGVILRNGSAPEGGTLHYILHYSQEEEKMTCPYKNVTDLLPGVSYEERDTISLKDWDVMILQEKTVER